MSLATFSISLFQSAPPVKGATLELILLCIFLQFQSAPPVKGATREFRSCQRNREVSIRAPREGGDASGMPVAAC